MGTLIQRAFPGGEISPSLHARVDMVKHATGLRTCRNTLIGRQGPAINRPGTRFVGEVKDSSKTVRLIPFVFNSSQTYALELGDLYMRIHKNGAPILLPTQDISGITNANPAVLTYVGADNYANGDEVLIAGVVGAMGQFVNGRTFKVVNVNVGAKTFELDYMDGTDVDSTAFGAYGSAGTIAEIYTIVSPFAVADLPTLNYVQSADVVTFVHPLYAPQELKRTAETSWAFSTVTFAPAQEAPTGVASDAPGAGFDYAVTAINAETREESLQSSTASSTTQTSKISWTLAAGATEYNIYKSLNGVFGFIGVANGTSFTDTTIPPDTSDTPPTARNPFETDFPASVSYLQQRLAFANTPLFPAQGWLSRTAFFKNFTKSEPTQDDDAIEFRMVGKQVNAIKHMLELGGRIIVLTTAGEWLLEGDVSGILRPADINPKQQTYNGSGDLPPIVINGNALYQQARGTKVRDLGFDYTVDGYKGNDLTIFAVHLFEGFTLSDWTYQQEPNSILWVVRSDGTLLGLTYVREHELWAWHRHDFDGGTVENVVAIPEGAEDALYLVVKRTVDSKVVRYVERMATRRVSDIVDYIGMDSALTYDGRNTGAETMTLTGGTAWVYTEALTLTRSVGGFAAADVGDEIVLTGTDGPLRCRIIAFTSTTVVTVNPHKTVPVSMRGVATTDWTFARDTVGGLWHLEGKNLSVLGDGFVVASPYHTGVVIRTVANGQVTLDKPYGVIHAGLPFISDVETLDVDVVNGETMIDKKKLITKVTLFLEKSRGIFAGRDSTHLTELKMRSTESYDDPTALRTGHADVIIEANWNSNGRVFIRQLDPLPMSILAIAPAGLIPIATGR